MVGHIGGMLADHAQARAAADAAALAGAMAGPAAAEEAATANGGTLVEIEVSGADTEVRVRVGDAVAVARARRGLSSAAKATRVHAMTGDDEISSSTDTARAGRISYTAPRARRRA